MEISVRSAVPPGCGTGTSAAVSVALLGALAALRSERPSPRDIAYAAHRLEVDTLGIESGIQDQLCAALGGINYIEIDPYPEAVVHALPAWEELDARLSLVFLGRAHDSSDLHRQVIDGLGRRESAAFSRLRAAATAARDAVLAQDLDAFGRAMSDNTEAQRSLHPGLVGVDADRVIEVAVAHGALGWKVNGAGGDGGSVTVLSATGADRHAVGRRPPGWTGVTGRSLSGSARPAARPGGPVESRENCCASSVKPPDGLGADRRSGELDGGEDVIGADLRRAAGQGTVECQLRAPLGGQGEVGGREARRAGRPHPRGLWPGGIGRPGRRSSSSSGAPTGMIEIEAGPDEGGPGRWRRSNWWP